MDSVPSVAVVGRTNKGKSSVVATLAELIPGDEIAVGERPGTTRQRRDYLVEADGKPVLKLIDTPGLEEAPRARDWLLRESKSAADRPEVVRAFVETFEGAEEFVEEVRALKPIVEGAGILYVVDGTQPYRDRHEAEMEVLQWAGRPRMALINRIRHAESGDADRIEANVASWRAALGQYFPTVTEFDAHRATFAQRVEILRTLAALDDRWRDAVRAAVDALLRQRAQRNLEAAGVIAGLIADAVTYTAELTLEEGESPERRRQPLQDSYHQHLKRLEDKARRRVERLYRHDQFAHAASNVDVEQSELFSEESWKTFGLAPKTLVVAAGLAGATSGGVIDAFVGGASFGGGAVLGGVGGSATALYYLTKRFAEASIDRSPSAWGRMMAGERRLCIGPHPNPNFGWVLLDRALAHLDVVRNWAHARPTDDGSSAAIATHEGRVETLDARVRKSLHSVMSDLRKKHLAPPAELRVQLERAVAALVEEEGG